MINDNYVNYFAKSIRDNWNLEALSDYKGITLSYGEKDGKPTYYNHEKKDFL